MERLLFYQYTVSKAFYLEKQRIITCFKALYAVQNININCHIRYQQYLLDNVSSLVTFGWQITHNIRL